MGVHDEIEALAAGFDGIIGLAARDFATGSEVLYHADRKCPTASVIKLPVLVHVAMLAEEGRIAWDEQMVLRDADKTPGSGILTQLTGGLRLTVRDAATLMVALSDNTATNMLLDRVGIEAVNQRSRSLGCKRTRLFRKVFGTGPPVCEENRRYGLGVTTPRDMLRLLAALHEGRRISRAVRTAVRRFLATQQHRDGIPRMLPAQWAFAGKGGAVDAVRNDVGFVTVGEDHDIALAIFCQRMPRPVWTCDNPGLLTIARLAKVVTDHFIAESELL